VALSTFEEGSYEFGSMKATSNSETELGMDREPTEMPRSRDSEAGHMSAWMTTTSKAGSSPTG
jgi:3-oxoacyl-(acyl-carrier-protein) synthase